MTQRRPRLKRDEEQDVLVRSRRRCCLCFGLEFDTSYKRIQIAHLDHDRTNNQKSNLAALCQPHHDEYDSRPSQTKGLTKQEVKHHREQLYKALEQADEQLVISTKNPEGGKPTSFVTPSAMLLGQVLEAFDREYALIEKHTGAANGIALTHLARIAIEHEGDFAVAKETFMSQVRLAAHIVLKSSQKGIQYTTGLDNSSLPKATPFNGAVKILQSYIPVDFILVMSVLSSAAEYAVRGDEELTPSSSTELPYYSVGAVSKIFTYVCRNTPLPEYRWALNLIADEMAQMLEATSMALHQRGVALPDVPTRIYIDQSFQRGLQEGQSEELLPLVQCISNTAYLPQDLFERVLSQLKFSITHWSVGVDPLARFSVEEVQLLMRKCAMSPRGLGAFCMFSVKNEQEAILCQDLIRELNESGQSVISTVKELLVAERAILMRRTDPRSHSQ